MTTPCLRLIATWHPLRGWQASHGVENQRRRNDRHQQAIGSGKLGNDCEAFARGSGRDRTQIDRTPFASPFTEKVTPNGEDHQPG